MVNQDGALFHVGEGAISTQYHSVQVLIVAHAAKNNVGIFDGFTRGGRMCWLLRIGKFLAPSSCLGGAAVVYRDGMARACQVPGHGITHDAKAQKGDILRRGRFVCFCVQAAHDCVCLS